ILAKEPSSPLEISKRINTSIAYVSQQLRLLEAGGLITKQKTGSSEKGKPRTVFSLSRELLQISVLMNKMPSRKIISLTDYHKLVLRIWQIDDSELHRYIEKFYFWIEEDISEISGIFVYLDKKPRILILSDSKKIRAKIDSFIKIVGDKFDFFISSRIDLRNFSLDRFYPIYDPKLLFLGFENNRELKGGEV
ncbi:MAG: winged helix-turn-helix domain-containing protein, partial [Candidatus Pacearchaeota archaeon]